MYRNILLAILGASLASASAVPVQMADPKDVVITEYPSGLPSDLIPVNGTEPADLETRSSGAGVYLCTERNFQGHCEHIWVPRGQCVTLDANLQHHVTSVGPDKPAYCFFFAKVDCQEGAGHFGTFSPGYSDLSSSAGPPGAYWNDRILSVSC